MASEVAFVEKFVGASFSSSTAFEMTLNEYIKDNFVIFARSSTGALQDQRKALESEESSKPSVFSDKKYAKHQLSSAVLYQEAKEPTDRLQRPNEHSSRRRKCASQKDICTLENDQYISTFNDVHFEPFFRYRWMGALVI
ncbi:hypothetical protein T265_07955 [Opisthorchis viverrini]|uniref:Uncharacterized protein n=1 Tax=Opisthorchis viverrini TaxID=6198 RepID=A0A074ZAM7_OPIVI|nr:hypothetical protein T265_07955 [Opisthorchis viverrini]KER24351.1 hypothetical protein T265_07955 [Opisthorchis viverrini]